MYTLLFSRSLASSAPIWGFTGMIASCDAFPKKLTSIFADVSKLCPRNIRLFWDELLRITETSKSSKLLGWFFIHFFHFRSRELPTKFPSVLTHPVSRCHGVKSGHEERDDVGFWIQSPWDLQKFENPPWRRGRKERKVLMGSTLGEIEKERDRNGTSRHCL